MLRAELTTRLGALELAVELTVAPGETLALAGPSGAGKTSVLRAVAGLARPDAGRVVCGEDVWLDTEHGVDRPPEQRRCGYLFQDYALFGHLTAAANVAYGLRGIPRAERRARAVAGLERFGIGGTRRPQAGDAVRRRAPAGRPGPGPGHRPGGPAARRAALGARRPQPRRRHPGPGRGPRLRGGPHPPRHPRLRRGGPARRPRRRPRPGPGRPGRLAGRAGRGPSLGLRGRLHRRGRAQRHGAPAPGGLTRVELDGGGTIFSVVEAEGPVAATVYPWEITLAPPGPAAGRLGPEPPGGRDPLDHGDRRPRPRRAWPRPSPSSPR